MSAEINLTPNQQMFIVQASSLSALFCWYKDYARKLDQQIQAVRSTSLTFPVSQNYWKGIGRQLIFQPAFPFIFGIKDKVLQLLTEKEATPAQDIFAAAVAGAATGPYCNVGEVYVLRRRVFPEENIYQSICRIWKHSGPKCVLKGTSLMMTRNATFAALIAGVNPALQNHLDQKFVIDNPSKTALICKSLAVNIGSAVPSALLAATLTMPQDNIAVRRQTQALGLDKSSSNLDAIRQIYKEHGWKGFFIGTKLRCRQATREFIAFNLCLKIYTTLFRIGQNNDDFRAI